MKHIRDTYLVMSNISYIKKIWRNGRRRERKPGFDKIKRIGSNPIIFINPPKPIKKWKIYIPTL